MPAGVMPGQAFHVQTPTGAMLQTVVPPGVEPGQTIMITLEQTMQPGSLNTATGTTAAFDGSWKMRTSLCCETNTATVTGTDTEKMSSWRQDRPAVVFAFRARFAANSPKWYVDAPCTFMCGRVHPRHSNRPALCLLRRVRPHHDHCTTTTLPTDQLGEERF